MVHTFLFLIKILLFPQDELQLEVSKELFRKSSFRMPFSKTYFLKPIIGNYLRLVKSIIKISERRSVKSKAIAIDLFNNRWDPKFRIKYLKSLSPNDEIELINKPDLITTLSVINRIKVFFLISLLLVIVPFVFFFKGGKKENAAIIFRNFAENGALICLIKSLKVSKVYMFCPYEVDSNFTSLLVNRYNAQSIKIPSPNPLVLYYRNLFADKIILTNYYQKEEIEIGLINIKGVVDFWIPENAPLYLKNYLDPKGKVDNTSVGFYSSSNWLRVEDGNHESMNEFAIEKELLLKVHAFCLEKGFKLMIFLHPREKVIERHRVLKYYESVLETKNLNIFSFDLGDVSASFFKKVDVAITPFTTLFFERIFCGYKTLMFSSYHSVFPLKESPLENICVHRIDQIIPKIEEALSLNMKEFFKKNELERYYLNGFEPDLLLKRLNYN